MHFFYRKTDVFLLRTYTLVRTGGFLTHAYDILYFFMEKRKKNVKNWNFFQTSLTGPGFPR